MPRACVLTEFGPPDVLRWNDVATPEPSEGQILIRVRVSGVGPTDLKIRRGELNGVFPLPEPVVLGFETAGVVEAIGSAVSGVAVGDEVAAWLPSLGGYGEYALAAAWTAKPPNVSWTDAGALPASAEAAVGVLRQLGVAEGETLLILGAGGSVGMIATQLAVRQGQGVRGLLLVQLQRRLDGLVEPVLLLRGGALGVPVGGCRFLRLRRVRWVVREGCVQLGLCSIHR